MIKKNHGRAQRLQMCRKLSAFCASADNFKQMKTLKRTHPNPYPERILQFGGGVFIRAFADWMIEILNRETDFSGSVLVIKPTKEGDYDKLRRQNGLFHVFLNGLKEGIIQEDIQLVQCINRVIHPFHFWSDYLKSAEQTEIRFIISNTTESGIRFSEIEPFDEDQCPKSFPAKLTHWLFRRFHYFEAAPDKGCIILPLELIANNGEKLKECILKYADLWGLESKFVEWINEHNIFCNTLVDRIVTGFPNQEAKRLEAQLDCKDELLVAGELYHNWIIEGPDQVRKELPIDKIGLNVKFVEDLKTHQQIKVRILNGAHTAMVPIGLLLHINLVSEAITHPILNQFITDLLHEEVLLTIKHSKKELIQFTDATIQRFQNTSIEHKLINIALNSTSKYVSRLHVTLLDYFTMQGVLPKRICFALAALIYLYKSDFEIKDRSLVLDKIKSAWANFNGDYVKLSKAILKDVEIWTLDFDRLEGMSSRLAQNLRDIDNEGIEEALKSVTS